MLIPFLNGLGIQKTSAIYNKVSINMTTKYAWREVLLEKCQTI